MNRDIQLKGMEGREYKAYPDPITKGAPWTIGVGHTGPEVHKGLEWDDAQIDAAYEADSAIAEAACQRNFPWYDGLIEPRKAVVWNMCFQMGIARLRGFTRALGAIRDERWEDAAGQMLDSAWAKNQTPGRARHLAAQMASGEWQ